MPSCLRFQIRVVAVKPKSENVDSPFASSAAANRTEALRAPSRLPPPRRRQRHLILWEGTQHSSPLAHMKMTNLPNPFHVHGGLDARLRGHDTWELAALIATRICDRHCGHRNQGTALESDQESLWTVSQCTAGISHSPMGPISRHVLHSSWNLGFVTGRDRILTLFLVQALNCCTIGENLNSSSGMCLNDPNRSSETTSAALFPVLIPLPQLCPDSAWQNSLIKSERFVQQARHTLTDAR